MAIYKSIIGVPKRREFIEKAQLPRLDDDYVVTYDNPSDPRWCWGNHVYAMEQALETGNQYSHYLVLEDDGLPVNDFDRYVEKVVSSPYGNGLQLLYRSRWSCPEGKTFYRNIVKKWAEGDRNYYVYRDIPFLSVFTFVTVGLVIPWSWVADIVAWDKRPDVQRAQQWLAEVYCSEFRKITHWRHFADVFLCLYCIHRLRDRWIPFASLVEHVGGLKDIAKGVRVTVLADQFYGDSIPEFPVQQLPLSRINYLTYTKALRNWKGQGFGEPLFSLFSSEIQQAWKAKQADQWLLDDWNIIQDVPTNSLLLKNVPVLEPYD